jgi:hypothetical protein
MARNDTRRFRPQPTDRAQLRAGVESWRALASVTVASALVVAVVVSVLTLLESVFSTSATRLARQSPAPSAVRSWHARTQPSEPFLPTPTQPEPALFVAD